MAAGKGTRMKSARPKVLHRLAGRALAARVLDCAARLSARQAVVITGHGADQVEAGLAQAVPGLALRFVRQEPQLGTGHAVQQALPVLADDGVTLVLSGDVPLTRPETLQALLDLGAGESLALLTLEMPDPSGYGRIVRTRGIDFANMEIGLPVLAAMMMMPLTFNITNGIGAGFVVWAVVKLFRGKVREVHPVMWVIAFAFLQHLRLRHSGQRGENLHHRSATPTDLARRPSRVADALGCRCPTAMSQMPRGHRAAQARMKVPK